MTTSRGYQECRVCHNERIRRKRKRVSMVLTCDVCGKEFERSGTTDKRCSDACRKTARRAYLNGYMTQDQKRVARNARVQAWRETNRQKANAEAQAQKAVRKGILKRGACEVGIDCEGPIHGHHTDYSKPLDVQWLCRKHHKEAHAKAV